MSDQGKILYDKLTELKYPKICKFSPSSFDWLFDNEEALPFLNWFCQTIQPEIHLLSDSELHKYDDLKKSGVTILEGRRLQEALKSQPEDMITNEQLESDIEQLLFQKEQLIKSKQNHIRLLNQLNSREKSVTKKLSDIDHHMNAADAHEEKLVEKLEIQSGVLHETMESLLNVTSRVVDTLNSKEPQLLYQADFSQFLKSEEDYTELLTKFANMQFQKNMGAMGQNSGSEMCAFIKIGDQNLGEILGLDGETRVIQNWELNCLQKLLPLVEEDRVVNETELAALQAKAETCKKVITDLVGGKFPSSPAHLKLAIDEGERCKEDYHKEYLSLRNEVLGAIKKSTQVRCSSVIVGDCSLKLLRQEYFISKQKEFLSFLARQWAREQLVMLAIRLEGRQLENLLTSLKSIAAQIGGDNHRFEERMNSLQEVIESEKIFRERNTIPSSDTVARSLLTVLESGSKSVISNYEDLAREAAALKKQVELSVSGHENAMAQQITQQNDLEKIVSCLEDLAFGAPLKSVTQPLSRSDVLSNAIQKLDTVRDSIKTKFVPVYKDFKNKQLGMKNDHLTLLERRLWTLFYSDPGSMQRKTDALNAKANSL